MLRAKPGLAQNVVLELTEEPLHHHRVVLLHVGEVRLRVRLVDVGNTGQLELVAVKLVGERGGLDDVEKKWAELKAEGGSK